MNTRMLEFVTQTHSNTTKDQTTVETTKDKRDMIPLFAFVSDTHLGVYKYDMTERAQDALDAFDKCLETAQAVLGPDGVVIHGGDFFNSPLVRPSVIIESMDILQKYDLDIFCIRGNHDGSYIKAKRRDIALQLLDHLLSYIEDGAINRDIRDYDIQFIFQSHMGKRTLKSLYSVFERCIETSRPHFTVLVIHSIVEGMSLGDEIPREGFKQLIDNYNVDLVLCGHLHNKFIDNELRLLCPGSLEKLSIDQAGYENGFFIIGLRDNKLDYQWIPIETRNMEDITIKLGDVSGTDVNELLHQRISEMIIKDGSVVRLTIEGRTDKVLPKIDKKIVYRALDNCLKVFVRNHIKKEHEKEVRTVSVSVEDALTAALKEFNIPDEVMQEYAQSMIQIAEEASIRREGWKEGIRILIQKLV